MKIELELSNNCEATESPYWLILGPEQNMRVSVHCLAGQITGPFFSRKEAEGFLKATRYNFSHRAVVYCHSGYHSEQYKNACRKARRMLKL